MTDYDSNPFADPEAANPFQDPSVQQATSNSSRGLEEFNPFEERNTQTTNSKTTPIVDPPTQPAVMKPTMDQSPPAYTVSAAQPTAPPGQEDILKRQEELERKAAELQRREQQMHATQYNTRVNNWPPVPSFCPVKPCFYQDFSVDIPLEFQRTVKIGYFIWIIYVALLILNVIVSLAYFIGGNTGAKGITFGVSILFLVLWTPLSFICWYRPMYKAFRSDSSFNFFLFFFIFAAQFLCTIVQAIGVDEWGSSGFLNGISMISGTSDQTANASMKTVGAMMIIMGCLWVFLAVAIAWYLKKVHSLYRQTGASFQKAQQEFAQGVATNPTVQTAAKDAGRAAAAGAADAAVSGAMSSVSSQNNRM
ncbi:secretory carrier-associated membrane protein 1-like isoform X1 [Acanthaster planci]|uniref:Secretory carrier-associated membrane protein n=1 Tax=Acanthaster planci TaxID=133434 RepID=A0A8B7ZI26_ACAPL|nr:secretory carrier-associated membrane protein 1-like isoform X1 [Acanthaster planci]